MSDQIEVYSEADNAVFTFASNSDVEWWGLTGESTFQATRPATPDDRALQTAAAPVFS